MLDTLTIRPVNADDAEAISAMLLKQSKSYLRYFHPFDFDLASIQAQLTSAQNDLYMGIFRDARLIGFFFCAAGMRATRFPPMAS